ncbi:MAG: hypothetical protein FWC45_02250 [Treponema sp.]|nr:hypothetical protein [Treponema sp.]
MSVTIILPALLFLHIASCGLWFLFVPVPKRSEAVFLLPLLFCLPVVGLLCVLISNRTIRETMETPVSALYRQSEKEALAVSTGRPELETVVPFDEVLLLSNDHARREVMMHILRRDPFQYLEMLKTARESSDVEITHYATATIMEIQRDLDIAMQNTEADWHANPDDLDTVNRFISALVSYIGTGLLLENRMIQLRQQLCEILEHKLTIFPNSRSAHLLLVENEISLGNYTRAAEVAAMMREKWPNDETSWLKSLFVCMAAGDAAGKAAIARQMTAVPINWSRSGREEVDFLCD